jgi:hypothetical protein
MEPHPGCRGSEPLEPLLGDIEPPIELIRSRLGNPLDADPKVQLRIDLGMPLSRAVDERTNQGAVLFTKLAFAAAWRRGGGLVFGLWRRNGAVEFWRAENEGGEILLLRFVDETRNVVLGRGFGFSC